MWIIPAGKEIASVKADKQSMLCPAVFKFFLLATLFSVQENFGLLRSQTTGRFMSFLFINLMTIKGIFMARLAKIYTQAALLFLLFIKPLALLF